jgi:nucleotide-binding universal stress UspA family protein
MYSSPGDAAPMTSPTVRRIAVAIDGSTHASAALDWAIDLARRYGSELTVVAVAPIVPVFIAPTEPIVPASIPPSEIGHYRETVEAALRRAKDAGVAGASGVAYEGVVVDELLDHLEKHPVDLFVMGSRGLSTARRILLGSVSTAIVAHAPCPVLVVRPPLTKPDN